MSVGAKGLDSLTKVNHSSNPFLRPTPHSTPTLFLTLLPPPYPIRIHSFPYSFPTPIPLPPIHSHCSTIPIYSMPTLCIPPQTHAYLLITPPYPSASIPATLSCPHLPIITLTHSHSLHTPTIPYETLMHNPSLLRTPPLPILPQPLPIDTATPNAPPPLYSHA